MLTDNQMYTFIYRRLSAGMVVSCYFTVYPRASRQAAIAAIDHLSLQGLPIRVTLYFRS